MSETTKKLGILGVGHLMEHVVRGLAKDLPASEILLSPRNDERARRIHDRFGFEIASDNDSLVERCETIIVAVRPFQIESVLTGLPWRDGKALLSFCAGVAISNLAAVAPGASIVRAMPVTAAEFSASPTCLFPHDEKIADLLASCGPVLPLSKESEFESASVMGCYFGWIQALSGEVTAWLEQNGLVPDTARKLVAEMTRASVTTIVERPDDTLDDLVEELCIPGSFTGLGLDKMRAADAFAPWKEACQAVLDKSRSG